MRLTDSGKVYAEEIIGRLHEKEMYVLKEMGLETIKNLNDSVELLIRLFRAGGMTEHESET